MSANNRDNWGYYVAYGALLTYLLTPPDPPSKRWTEFRWLLLSLFIIVLFMGNLL